MKKEKNKKRKILKCIIFLIMVVLIVLYGMNIHVKNIYVIGNNTLSDWEIIELAGLDNYPKLFQKSCRNLESKIKINPMIERVKVKKNLLGKVTIYITEYKLLLKDEVDNGIYLSNLNKLSLDNPVVGIPSLINYVDSDILKAFLTKLNTIDSAILGKISEIEYTPNEYDKNLFLFYMNDGNYVYITTTRLLNINKYESVLTQLDGKKGILYLDSGNHFKILE